MSFILSFLKAKIPMGIFIIFISVMSIKILGMHNEIADLRASAYAQSEQIYNLKYKSFADDATISNMKFTISHQNESIENLVKETQERQKQARENLEKAKELSNKLNKVNQEYLKRSWTEDSCKDIKDLLKEIGE